MRAVIQRVTEASVTVDQQVIGEIKAGLLVLICAMQGDDQTQADYLVKKIAKLRIFKDEAGKMNRSVSDTSGAVLVISQFTLAADTHRGNRPGFSTAAPPAQGEALYTYFADQLEAQGLVVQRGSFGADMQVRLLNDGPVTIWMDSAER
ncbi:D-tyrosyl-tRNA deacylase [Roseobacter sp. MED193]|uniref:D-aminoacyl-tRNA deacylase n=1 Tax=Roseobacter sp. MED193 TaxID=314262 RepID=UPI000068BA40|nr:D-aminoacyl-tRNA deacylase [Roseobacter sp. MED193]EAQ43467.1 D-tyrosyl-tRNA deacylase [Roseobacter sp. MED193]